MIKPEISGIHVWEGCNREAFKLQERYGDVKRKENEIRQVLVNIEREKAEIRKLEVNNVLNFVRSYAKILPVEDVDMYLCHCSNMLFGNIDGTILEFTDPRERK